LKRGRPVYDDVTYEEVIKDLVETLPREVRVNISIEHILQRRDVGRDVAETVERTLKKHKEKVWITFLVGLITGLVTNGIYDVIKEAVMYLVFRAPYPEAQIYEVESDLYKTASRWKSCLPDGHGLDDEDTFVAFTYSIHAMAVAAVLGVLEI